MNFIGHFSFYRNVLQNTQKMKKEEKKPAYMILICEHILKAHWLQSFNVCNTIEQLSSTFELHKPCQLHVESGESQ